MELILPSQALRNSFVGADSFSNKNEEGSVQDAESVSYHAFRIGDIGLLIPQDSVSEVADELAYCQLPNTSNVLFGMANQRGNIIPIFDLHKLFDFVVKSDDATRKVLIIGRGEDSVGVLTDGLPTRVLVTPASPILENPDAPVPLQPYLKSCYQVDGNWFSWDLNNFFDSINTYIHS